MAGPIATLTVRLLGDTKQFGASMGAAQTKLAATSAKMSTMGKGLTKGLTVPLIAIGAGAMAAQAQIGGAMRTIRRDTGATGKKLDGLGNDFKAVMKGVPQSAGEISKVLATLQTRTGLTGKPLQNLTKTIMTLGRVAGVETAGMARLATRAFSDWEIQTQDQTGALDYLWKVSQQTGIKIDSLSEKVVKFGAPMRQLGFSFKESAALIGSFEKAGVNVDQVLASLKIGLGKLAKAGESPSSAFKRLVAEIQATDDPTQRLTKSIELFGARAGTDMAEAIKQGRFSIDELMGSLDKSKETIKKAGDDTLTFSDKMKMLKNEAIVAAAPLGKTLWEALRSLIGPLRVLVNIFSRVIGAFNSLPAPVKTGVIVFGGLLAAMGPVMRIGGRLLGTFSRMGGAVSGALKWIGRLGGGMSGVSNMAANMQTPLLASNQATGQLGATATTSATKFGSFMSAALPIAGVLAGVGLATWACISADNKAEDARRKGIIAASDMTGSLETLRSKTQSLTEGTAEYNAAMAEQAAKAQEIVEKTGLVGAVFDELGNVIDADTSFINLMADGYRKGTTAQVELAEATARGTQTLFQGITVHSQYGQSVEGAKKKLDDFKAKMYEKMRAGQQMSANDQVILSALTRDWQSAAKGQGGALDSMQKAVDAFGLKLQGPQGMSAVTKRDLGSMVTAMANTSPKVREKGLAMFQQIINAEAAKNPAIQSNMSTIMSGVKNKIDALPAGERTAAKLQEIITEETNKYGPITSEMGTIMGGLSSVVDGTDLSGAAATMMATLKSGITSASYDVIAGAQEIANRLAEIFASVGKPGGGGGKPEHGGGRTTAGLAMMQGDEFVIRRSSARRLPMGALYALNRGVLPLAGGGDVNLIVNMEAVSPDYDSDRLVELTVNKMARRANHTGRLLRKGR